MFTKTYIPSLLFLLFLSAPSAMLHAQETRTLATGLNTPWEILWGPDNFIWMTERGGTVSRVDPNTGQKTVIATIGAVHEVSESGLMGMALHPDFDQKPYVYLAYNYFSGSIKVRIARYEYSNGQLDDEQVLIDNIAGNGNHNGCRLVFGPDGKLYASTGDAQNTGLPQNDASLNGKILRLNDDGSIPADNPDPASYVWCKGLRNTQGLVWAKGKLYGSEHGPSTDDEVNMLQEERNFGWPNVNGFCDQPSEEDFCQQNNVVEPLKAWTPTIAPCGLDYYSSDGPVAAFRGRLLMTSLKGSTLYAMLLNDDGTAITGTTTHYSGEFGRLRDLCISPEGKVYIATSNRDGRGNPIAEDDRIIEIYDPSSSLEDERALAVQVSIYPNPAHNEITLSIEDNTSGYVEILDMQGQTLFKEQITRQTSINCSQWAGGLYLLRYTANGRSYTRKLVLKQ